MKVETFFEQFDRLACTPGAIARMRELVLDLALAGSLSREDGCGLGQRRWASLSELQPVFQNGASSRGQKDGVPVIVLRLADIKERRISLDDPRTLTINPADIAKYGLRPGDILITRVNGSADLVGSFVAVERDLDAIYCDHFIRMRLDPNVADPGFLAIVGRSRGVRDQIKALFVTTAGQKTVNQGHIGSLRIPFPPLAEQKRIVAKVDELMALCDRLEEQQQERETRHVALSRASLARFADAPTPANLELLFHKSYDITPADLRKTILTLAVQGKLVPQDPYDELAYTLPPGQRPEAGCYSQVPPTWRWLTLADVAQFINGDRSKNYPSKGLRVAEGVPFINAGHLRDGEVSVEGMDYITEDHFDRLRGGKISRGDVLYCLRGSLGKSAVVSSVERGAIASSLLILRPGKALLSKFLHLYLVSPLGTMMIARYDNGSAQPNLSAANVKRFSIPVPPLAEQRRIVAKVDELMALVDALETQLTTAHDAGKNLLAAVVAELTGAA